MVYVGVKPGHNGHIAAIQDNKLLFSVENEKWSGGRYSELDQATLFRTFGLLPNLPDTLVTSGWHRGVVRMQDRANLTYGAGYFGHRLEHVTTDTLNMFGKSVNQVGSTHEKSHLFCSYGLSPFPEDQPVYAIVWEGMLARFYRIDPGMKVTILSEFARCPGVAYTRIYTAAGFQWNRSIAGKVMALAAFGDPNHGKPAIQKMVDQLKELISPEPHHPSIY